MASLESLDLERGHRSSADGGGATSDTAEGDEDFGFDCSSEILEDVQSQRSCDCCSVDLESGEKKVHLQRVERDCRICHLSLLSRSPSSGVAIELGCSCKDDLAAAHKHCAETWFKIKGNKTCEICNSIAINVVGPNDIEAGQQQANESSIAASNPSSSAAAPETRACLNGHRFLNFLLACMVFAFVISWLFHFNLPQ